MMKIISFCVLACAGMLTLSNAYADDITMTPQAIGHAPLGVMGDHIHKKGEVMFSYRFGSMEMEGSRDGTESLSADQIATTYPNRYFGVPGQPPTLRIVPEKMTMDMHMFGMMYAPTDKVTLMAMGNYTSKSMDHITYQGGAGTNRLGGFTTRSSGVGDVKLQALIGLYDDNEHKIHANVGLSLPTGSVKESGQILAPNGATPTVRLPYGMQLGSGTFDFLPGITYTSKYRLSDHQLMSFGAQAKGMIRLGRNSENYSLGDMAEVSVWTAYAPASWISFSGRLKAQYNGKIDGRDTRIMGPVQTADPDNYGGKQVQAFLGVNLAGQNGFLKGHRIAVEFGLPVYRNLNGPQLETDWTFMIGYQVAF